MTKRKDDVVRHFAPRFASRETMAYMLDMSTDTFDGLVASGKIQAASLVGGLMRWPVEQVFGRLEGYGVEGEPDEAAKDRDDIRAGTARVFGRPPRQRRSA